MPHSFPKKSNLTSFFFKASFLPFTILLLLLLVANTYLNISRLHKELHIEGKRMANSMAVVAAQDPVPTELMAKQVDVLLKQEERLVSITFYPLTESLPEHKNHSLVPFDAYISENAPVIVSQNANGEGVLVGYINVTMDFAKARRPILLTTFAEALVAMLFLGLLFFTMMSMMRSRFAVVNNLMGMSKKILAGDYDIHLNDEKRATTTEMRTLEDVLIYAANKLKLHDTELKQLRRVNTQLTQKEQAYSHQQATFQSMITHELRTPLNAIAGGLQLFETKNLEASHLDSLNLVRGGYNKLTSMLDHIIALNNLQQGKVSIEKTVFSPEQLLRDVAYKYSPLCLQKGLILSVDIKHTEIKLVGDTQIIKDILEHIMSNALKFTDSGSIRLVSNVMYLDNDNELEWSCSVVDTGIGIEEHLHTDIFNAYVQADTGNKREYEGSGLGLTLAKKMAELLEGKIVVTSEANKGSTFSLKLVLNDALQEHTPLSLAGLKIMHLHSGETAGFADTLNEMHAQAVAYQDVEMAMVTLASQPFDLVTMCNKIREESAIKLARFVRSQEKEHRVTIAYFIKPNRTYDQLALKAAGVDYLTEFTDFHTFSKQAKQWLVD